MLMADQLPCFDFSRSSIIPLPLGRTGVLYSASLRYACAHLRRFVTGSHVHYGDYGRRECLPRDYITQGRRD